MHVFRWLKPPGKQSLSLAVLPTRRSPSKPNGFPPTGCPPMVPNSGKPMPRSQRPQATVSSSGSISVSNQVAAPVGLNSLTTARKSISSDVTPNATLLVRQHRFDGSPFVVAKFVAHDSRLRFRSLNQSRRCHQWLRRSRQFSEFTSAFGVHNGHCQSFCCLDRRGSRMRHFLHEGLHGL
jgi:hypothetical protein